MKTLVSTAALALAAAALPTAAAENTTAWASIADYGFTLVDLDPNDGIAPSMTITFRDQTAYSYAAGYANNETDLQTAMGEDDEPITAAATAGNTHVESTFSLPEISSMGSLGWGGEYYSSANWYSQFTLTPHTRLVLTGRARAEVVPGVFATSHYARARARASLTDDGGSSTYENAVILGLSPELGFDEQFSIERSNDTDAVMQGTFAVRTDVLGNMHPVPEPASWCMLLAGLGIAGIAARRAKR